MRDALSGTLNTETVSVLGLTNAKGLRYRDNSSLYHYEGMYNFSEQLKFVDVLVGGSIRHYSLLTDGTLLPRKADGSEYTINEYGAYIQASKSLVFGAGYV